MRDSTLMAMRRQDVGRDALILRQLEFVETRQEAFERLLKVSPWWTRIKFIFNFKYFLELADAVQVNLLNERKKQMQAAMSKTKIEVVSGI